MLLAVCIFTQASLQVPAAEPMPLPDEAVVARVPVSEAATISAAWTTAWRSWFERSLGPDAGADRQSRSAVVRAIAGSLDAILLPPVALAPAAELLISRGLLDDDEAKQVCRRITRRLLTLPFGDARRIVAVGEERGVLSDADGIRKAIAIADAAGTDAEFYAQLSASVRARTDPQLKREVERRFLGDQQRAYSWLLAEMAFPPESWGVDTLRVILKGAWEQPESRRAVLERAILAALALTADPKALDLRARLLLDLALDADLRWRGLLSVAAMSGIEAACDAPPDIRFAALPWLILLHAEAPTVRACLSRHGRSIVAWNLRAVGGLAQPKKGGNEEVDRPWAVAMPALPLALTEYRLDETELMAVTKHQSTVVDDESEYRTPKPADLAALVTRTAFAAIIAQDQAQLRTWWADPGIRFEFERDVMFRRALAPWAFASGALGPWTTLPKTAAGTAPSRQYRIIARSGPTAEAIDALRKSFTDKRANGVHHRALAWLAASADRALASELAAHQDALPTTLQVDPVSRIADPDEAALWIDLHLATGNRDVALAMAREAANLQRAAAEKRAAAMPDALKAAPSTGEKAAETRDRLFRQEWEWTAIQARLVRMQPDDGALAPTLKLIVADVRPIGRFAHWVVEVVGIGSAGPLPVVDYLEAARDRRFPALMMTLAASPVNASRYLPELSDPRVMRGWALGHPEQGWLGSQPTERPIVEVLTALTILRLARSRPVR